MYRLFKAALLTGALVLMSTGCKQPGESNLPEPNVNATAAPAGQAEKMGNWAVNRAQSHIRFTGSQQGVEFTGSFGEFNAVINFDKNAVDQASVTVSIDLSSVDTGDKDRNDALPGRDWFFVKNFPTATFMSDDFVHEGNNRYEARGTLTVKGIKQDMTLPFTLDFPDGVAVMDSELSIDRTLWDIGTGEWSSGEWVGKDVTINIHVEAANPY